MTAASRCSTISNCWRETLAASEFARKNVVNMVASEYTVGWSLMDEVREFLLKLQPEILARHLVGGLTVGEMVEGGFDLAKFKEISLGAAAVQDDLGYFVLPPVPTIFSSAIPPAGSTTV